MSALVHGHAHPAIVAAIAAAAADGASLRAADRERGGARRAPRGPDARARAPPLRQLGHGGGDGARCGSRARSRRQGPGILRFEGCYHGAYDAVLESARGVPPGLLEDQVIVPWGDVDAFTTALRDTRPGRLRARGPDAQPRRAHARPAGVRARPARGHRGARRAADRRRGDHLPARARRAGTPPTGVDARPGHARQDDRRRAAGGRVRRARRRDGACTTRARRTRSSTAARSPRTRSVMRAGLASLELLDEGAIARINALGDDLRERLRALGFEVNGRGSLTRVLHDDAGRAVVAAVPGGRADRAQRARVRRPRRWTRRTLDDIIDRFATRMRVVVVGAGALGLCTARELTKLGVTDVTVIDRAQRRRRVVRPLGRDHRDPVPGPARDRDPRARDEHLRRARARPRPADHPQRLPAPRPHGGRSRRLRAQRRAPARPRGRRRRRADAGRDPARSSPT